MEISVSTPMRDDGNCQVIEHLEARPLRARRGWSAEAKARLVEKTLVPGANVSAIARRIWIEHLYLAGDLRKRPCRFTSRLAQEGRGAGDNPPAAA